MSAGGRLARTFAARHPRRAARRMGGLAADEVAAWLADGPLETAAETLQHVDPVHVGRVLERMAPIARRKALLHIPPRRLALILQDAPEDVRAAWLDELPEDLAGALRARLTRDPDTVARFMDPAVLAAPVELNAGEARDLVGRHAHRALYYLYVVDADRRPVGVLNLRELMGAPSRTPLAGLMHAPVLTLPARTPIAVAAVHPGWKEFHALPVVDEAGTLLGVVRYEAGEVLRGRAEADVTTGSVGVALTEAMWTLTTHMVDEVASAVRPRERDDD